MARTYWEIFAEFYEYTVFFYGVTLLLTYAMLAIMSIISITQYRKKDANVDYDTLVSSPLSPGVSVIAPAFNESLTIIFNVRSLLTFNYPKFEVIIVNDGSTDDTLQKMVYEFELIEVDFAYNPKLQTRPVYRVLKSTNKAYSNLMVIDKENGKSKADAVNAGINAAAFDYFVCSDVDCILDKDTILKLIKPVLDEEKYRVIATGATLRMANSCDIDKGVITRVRPPRQWLARFQEMEYIRAFILGKMGWNFVNCVPNVSGGLGLFDREIAVKCGGYDHTSFGEDMELMYRMIRYSCDQDINYAIRHVPYTLCWTEGPSSIKFFMRQRTRWSRGLAQLMYAHFPMLLNPRYGRMGMVVFPYGFLFELCAPVVELLGIIFYIVSAILGLINWPFAIILLVFVYTYSIMVSTLAILYDQVSNRTYRTWREVASLCIMPFIEMFVFHPMVVIFAIRGYYFALTGKKAGWGAMQRTGFGGPQTTPEVA